ncbi:MAG: hypothetical protein GXP27_08770, partial [Planctomycetes bacterium]|nr:hypothetical protein [Planctomycetota bacterium]
TAALRVPEGWQCQRRSHVEFAVTAPKGGVGKTAHLMASARVEAVSGLALPLQRTADLRIVPALEANLRLTDISGDGRRFRFFVELINHSSTASDVSIQPELPPGWRFLPDPAGTGERRLSPRSAEKRTLTVVASQSAQPGQYPIGVRVVSAKLDSPLELRQSLFFVPGSRNRLVNPGFESGRTGWAKNERDFTIDRSQSHSGQNSLKLSNGSASLRCGASQTIVLNQKTPRPVFVRGFAKAEEVSGVRDRGFSIYVDIYHTDGTPSYGHAITFQTGTTDWQYGELLIHPKKPIRNVNVYLLLRGHRGTVWFDDILAAELPARDGGRAGSNAKGQ